MKNITQFQLRRNARISPARQSQLRARVAKIFAGVVSKFDLPNRPLGKKEFLLACQKEKIILTTKESNEVLDKATGMVFLQVPSVKGFYAQKHGFAVIYLRCFLLTRFDRFTAFHELGHHFLGHVSGRKFESPEAREIDTDEKEFEADYFALLALGQKEVSA